MVNQTLENMRYEIRCYHEQGIQYTNLLCCNMFDTVQIYNLYVNDLHYAGVQVWCDGVNITDSVANSKTGTIRK